MNDKKYHILFGGLVAIATGLIAYLESGNLFAGIWSAMVSGIIAGGIKEWCDNTYTGYWDVKDFLATCIGAVIVVLFILGLHFGKG